MTYVNITAVKRLFAIAVVGQISVMILVAFEVFPVTQPTAVNNTLLGSLLATVSSYILYWQTKLQENQAEIEEKMFDLETKPVLEVVNKSFNNNDVEIKLTNYGHGVAVDLQLNCRITAQDVSWYEGMTCQTSLKRIGESGVLEDSSIRPQEEPNQFIAKSVNVRREQDSEGSSVDSSFETVMDQLLEEEAEKIKVSLWVSGDSKIGRHKVEAEVCDTFELQNPINIPQSDLQTSYKFQI